MLKMLVFTADLTVGMVKALRVFRTILLLRIHDKEK
jgi:hypothetical protein